MKNTLQAFFSFSFFCAELRQRINLSKSKDWNSPYTSCRLIQAITTKFGIPSNANLRMYLSTPLIHGQIRSHNYQYLVDHMHCRMGSLKTKLLSRASRIVLIMAVFMVIINIYNAYLCITNTTNGWLEKINWDFLLGDDVFRLVCQKIGFINLY